MREAWHGDNRDLVKWSAVADHSRLHRIERLIYVPFLRRSSPPNEVDLLVWRFFRSLGDLERLAESLGIALDMVPAPFSDSSRDEYAVEVMALLQRSDPRRRMVLLDPDTGIEPEKTSERHVSVRELCVIWTELDRPGDLLLVYQHRWRSSDWLEIAQARLRQHLAGAVVSADYRPTVAHDVALLVAQRPR